MATLPSRPSRRSGVSAGKHSLPWLAAACAWLVLTGEAAAQAPTLDTSVPALPGGGILARGLRPERGTRRWGRRPVRGQCPGDQPARRRGPGRPPRPVCPQGRAHLGHDAGGWSGADCAADADHGPAAPAGWPDDVPLLRDDGPAHHRGRRAARRPDARAGHRCRAGTQPGPPPEVHRDPHGAVPTPSRRACGPTPCSIRTVSSCNISGASSTAAGPAARSSSIPTSPTRWISRRSDGPVRRWPPVPRRCSRPSSRTPSATGSTTSTAPS